MVDRKSVLDKFDEEDNLGQNVIKEKRKLMA